MSRAEFVHLHVHSEYSLLEGACRLGKLIQKAQELEFTSLACTDLGAMYGAVDFYQGCHKKGLKPILGCEAFLAPGDRLERKSNHGERDAYSNLVLLVQNRKGYENLCELVSFGFRDGFYYKPRIDKNLLEQYREGLIVLSGPHSSGSYSGEIPRLIQKGDLEEARRVVDWYRQVFGPDHFYLELQDHGLRDEQTINKQLLEWGREFGLKTVATNDVYYVEKSHSHAHDCLLCIGKQTQLTDTRRRRFAPEQYYLRSAEEMKARFAEVPEAIQNTLLIDEMCHLELEFDQLNYPTVHPPEGHTNESYLRQLLAEAMQTRYGMAVRASGQDFEVESIEDPSVLPTYQRPEDVDPAQRETVDSPSVQNAVKVVLDRLKRELDIIEQMGFVSYFIIVGDFVQYGRSIGVSCVARGSAAGSLVTYLLEISNVDPIKYHLLFERFLNPERVNPPDIDIDFADDRRADIIRYVREKYGSESVAHICTFGTMGAKSVIRDVGRVMGLSYGECDRLAKMVPNDLKITLQKALDQSPDLKGAYETEDITRELIDTAFVLEDVARNASVHAAAVVIWDQPLVRLLPVKPDEHGTLVTQYAMNPVGDLGLLKMDFLGLKTLTVIRNTCAMVREGRGEEIPIDTLPLDDAPSYDLLNKGNTVGVFQLESSGMRDLCRRFQIASIEHITALISIYRPGPMDLIPDFIRRRHGEVEIEYLHPLMEDVSKETYGILIYQEQVMQATQLLAGFTLGGADLLRRAMGKKKVEVMVQQRKLFVDGCRDHNKIPAEKANAIFDLLEKFAGYGFNKSHAAAYAIVAYQTAYLKANYPVEFLSAMMTNDLNDTGKLTILINEAASMGIEVLPPDINESSMHFAPAQEGTVIRFGLAAIKGVGEAVVEKLIEAREAGGSFQGLLELCDRVGNRVVNRKVLEALIKSGACDCLGETRATLLGAIDYSLTRAANDAMDRASGQESLFGMLEEPSQSAPEEFTRLEECPESELLAWEKELLGFYVTGHPLKPYASVLDRFGTVNAKSAKESPPRSMVRLGGMVTEVNSGFSKKSGKPYAMLKLEDLHGSFQVLCMNENYDQFRSCFEVNLPLLVTGEVNNAEDIPKLFPVELLHLDRVHSKYTLQVHLRLRTVKLDEAKLLQALEIVQQHPGERPLFLCLMYPTGELVFIEAHDRFFVTPSQELQMAIEEAFGEGSYYAKVDTTLPEAPKKKWERKAEPTAA